MGGLGFREGERAGIFFSLSLSSREWRKGIFVVIILISNNELCKNYQFLSVVVRRHRSTSSSDPASVRRFEVI